MLKNMGKTSLERQQNCSIKKSTPKRPNVRKITSVPKSETLAIMHGLYPLKNRHFGSIIKILKNMGKTTLEREESYSMQESTIKNAQYSKQKSVPKLN